MSRFRDTIPITSLITSFIITLVAVKFYFNIKYFVKPVNLVPSTPQFSPKVGLGDIYNYENETFKILNRENVRFLAKPSDGCNSEIKILIMVSSGPKFYHKRDEWRQRAKKYTDS